MSKPAISDAAARLERSGIIIDSGVRGGRRGGVATLYRIDGARGHSLAVEVRPDGVSVRGTDLAGAVIFDHADVFDRTTSGRDRVVSVANRLLADAAAAIGTPLTCATVSVAVPVDRTTGEPVTLARSPFPSGQFSPVRELALDPDVPIVVDNDVNWATLAERHLGSMTSGDDFVYVYCGTGLGAGIYSSGRMQRGFRGLAGEIGYTRGPGPGDLTEALAALGLGVPGTYGIDVGRAGELFARHPLPSSAVEALDLLAAAIANAVILLNPSALVLGGPLTTSPAFVAGLSARVGSLALDPPAVVLSTHAPLEGASYEAHRLAREHLGF
jgi:predicted NBD/HSP70 family sugar kinase